MVNIYKLVNRNVVLFFSLTILSALTAGNVFAQLNGSYTINKNAAVSSTNYITFQSFFTALATSGVSGNVTCTVLNGPYTEQVTANAIPNASSTKQVTINGNNQILQFSGTSSLLHTLLFNGADYVTVKSLDIRGTNATYAYVVRLANLSEYITLDGCNITAPNLTTSSTSTTALITASGSATSTTTTGNNVRNFTVKNCYLSGGTTIGPGYGIVIYEASTTLDYIKIHNNVFNNIYYMYNRLYYCDEVEYFGNEFKRTTGFTGITTTYGLYTNQCGKLYIRRNKLHDLFPLGYSATFYGFLLTSNPNTNGSDISNNVIYNNTNSSTTYNIYNSSSPGVNIVHNTVSFDNQAYSYSGTVMGIYHTGTASGQLRNNIISLTTPGSGTRYGIYHSAAVSTVNNNNVYITGSGTNYYGYSSSGGFGTLAAWQSAPGSGAPFGLNDVDVNPMFVNASIGSLTPRSIAVDGIGFPVGITTDFNNNPRDVTNPDPGAIEFDIPANVTRLVLAGPSSCEKQVETVKVWVKNSALVTISGFSMAYRVNGGTAIVEPYTGSLNPGDSAQFTFNTKYTYNAAGIFNFEARIVGKPFVGPYKVTVNPAPVGSEVVKGSTYTGQFNSGKKSDPDIVANPDEVNFELTPPTGYSNSGFGTTWYISKLVASTFNGGPLNSADTATFIANAGGNARIRFRPSTGYTDSFVKFTTTIYSLTTNCYAPDIERVVFVAPRPKVGSVVVDICDGDNAVFASTSTISSGIMNYVWDFGDGNTSNYADNVKKYATYGTYSVKLTVTSNYGYTDAVTKTVNVYRKPTTGFTAVNQCAGSAVPFTNNSTVYNGSATYSWDFGDGVGKSSAASPSYAYPSVGSFMAKLTVVDGKGCTQSFTKPITNSVKPVADFSHPIANCNQADISFTNKSIAPTSTGYIWKFGDGSSISQINPMHSYANPGTYKVTIIALNEFGCMDSMAKTLVINEAPTIGYNYSTGCIGVPVDFVNTTTEPAGSTVTYSWKFGDGTTSSNKNETHTYLGVGDFDISLKAVASNGCETEKTSKVTFAEKPIADFAIPQTACVSDKVDFVNNSVAVQSALSYAWDLGNGTSTDKDPAVTYTSAGTYTVTLVASTTFGCNEKASKTITISNVPNSNFNFESAKTGDGRITFKPENPNGQGNYVWVYGDGSQGAGKGEHDYRYLSPIGLFKVTLKITENGCSSMTTKELVINALGVDGVDAGLNIEVYPNPNNGNFVVEMGAITNGTVTIFNTNGQAMKQYNVAEAVNGKLPVNLSDFAAGVYFVQLQSDGMLANKKVTVIR